MVDFADHTTHTDTHGDTHGNTHTNTDTHSDIHAHPEIHAHTDKIAISSSGSSNASSGLAKNNNVNFDLVSGVKSLKQIVIDYAPRLLISILILVVFNHIADWAKNLIIGDNKIIVKSEHSVHSDDSKNNLLYYHIASMAYYIINFFGLIFALTNLGIQTATILTILGTFIVAIGLSFQNTLSNIWAGLYITFAKLYKIGDLVKVNTTTGIISKFTLFNTTIIDKDLNVPVIIPNLQMQNNFITNFSGVNF